VRRALGIAAAIVAAALAPACGDGRGLRPEAGADTGTGADTGAGTDTGTGTGAGTDTGAGTGTDTGAGTGAGAQGDRYVAVLVPVEAIELAPRVDGVLVSVRVRPGDVVAPGDPIADLDPRPLREALAEASAAASAAAAAARQADVDVASARRLVSSETEGVAAGTRPRSAIEEAGFALERAVAIRERARAGVAEAAARVEKARSQLTDATVRAPFAGRVTLRYRDPGASAGPGLPVVRLIGDGGVRLRFAVPPAHAARLRAGAPITATITTEAQPARAIIDQITPELDPASGLVLVEAELPPDVAGRVQPGLAAWVDPVPPP
jgi:RND family efflux transporter MFP subunit